MSASNDELLIYAVKSGDLNEVKDLLSNGTGTSYRDEASYIIIYYLLSKLYYYYFLNR